MTQAAGGVLAGYWKPYKGLAPAERLVQPEEETHPSRVITGRSDISWRDAGEELGVALKASR